MGRNLILDLPYILDKIADRIFCLLSTQHFSKTNLRPSGSHISHKAPDGQEVDYEYTWNGPLLLTHEINLVPSENLPFELAGNNSVLTSKMSYLMESFWALSFQQLYLKCIKIQYLARLMHLTNFVLTRKVYIGDERN